MLRTKTPIEVRVTLIDANDHDPEFSAPSLKLKEKPYPQVQENTKNATTVAVITADDKDTGNNGKVEYMLKRVHSSASPSRALSAFDTPFKLQISGTSAVLVVAGTIDYETTQWFSFVVTASDKGSPSRSVDLLFQVDVTDVNEHAPVFVDLPYTKTLQENAKATTVVVKLSATDKDGTDNTISYGIAESASADLKKMFKVNANNEVEVTGTIPFQVDTVEGKPGVSKYDLPVYAIDSDQIVKNRRKTETKVTININNVDDEAPIFIGKSPVPNRVLSEGAIKDRSSPFLIHSVAAIDPDGSKVR